MLKNEIRTSYMVLKRKEREGQQGLTGKLVIQCSAPHLVGQVKVFGPSITSEAQRILFERNVPSHLWYRQPGSRIYIHLAGTYYRNIDSDSERQMAPRFTLIARDMMQEAIDSGLISKNDLKYYQQLPREEYNYSDEDLALVIDDFMAKGY